jgi:hypothetical protein
MIHTANNLKPEYNLIDIIRSEELITNFPKNYLPEVTETSDEIFILTAKTDMTGGSANAKILKFLILDKDLKPVHWHDYQYAPMPRDGYLMRISVPVIQTDNANEFKIDYLINIQHVIITDSFQSGLAQNSDKQSFDDIGSKCSMLFENAKEMFDNTNIMSLISNSETFFNTYL